MVPCPVCSTPVDWVTVSSAADVLKVDVSRVRQLIARGDLPGAVKVKPDSNIPAFWKIPIASVVAYKRAREES